MEACRMKVAIATQGLARVDAHLGWARHLMIFEVDEEGYCFLETASFPGGRQDGDPNKLTPRLKAMEGCQLVFVADVGPDGELGLARSRVTPIRKFAGEPIALALEALRDGMRGQAPTWLRHAEQNYRRRNAEN
jgi:nitrogen fixation protein NifX